MPLIKIVTTQDKIDYEPFPTELTFQLECVKAHLIHCVYTLFLA